MTRNNRTYEEDNLREMRIAIIGAGASGLAAARVFTRNGIKSVKVFEKNVLSKDSGLGGVWRYRKKSALDENSPPQPMYQSLRTNIPREVMRFREKPWGSDGVGKSFVTHKEVLSYLEEYASDYNLSSYIEYGCKVTQLTVEEGKVSLASPSIEDINDKPWPKITLQWEKQDIDISKQAEIQPNDISAHKATFDVVCICNGHYSIPSSPSIPGIDNFKGKVVHSVEYDDAAIYANQTVLCVGGRASGLDIAREISHFAKKVYLSDTAFPKDQKGVPVKNENVIWVPKTERVENIVGSRGENKEDRQRVYFGDDCALMPEDIDVIMFCSGYDYDFPFINEKSNLELSAVKGEGRVGPLYKQLWHAENPSLAFVGLPHSVVPFPLFEIQAEAVVAQVKGRAETKLPCVEKRRESAGKDFVGGGVKKGRIKDTHYLGKAQWDYYTVVSKMSDCYDEKMQNFIATSKAIFEHSEIERKGDFPGSPDLYRETCYMRDDENKNFRVYESMISSSEKVEILSKALSLNKQ